jgi:hypothetical protein
LPARLHLKHAGARKENEGEMMFSHMANGIAAGAAASGKILGQLSSQISGGIDGLFNRPGRLTVWFAIGFLGGLYVFFKGFGVYRDYRLEEDIPQAPVRGAAMGLVHVNGKAEGGETILSPVSQTPCLFYRLRVERQQEHSAMWQYNRAFDIFGLADSVGIGSSVKWITDKVVDNGPVFYLDDGTGKVAVDLHGAEFLVEQSGQCEMDPVSADAAAGGSMDLVTPESYGNEGPDGEQRRLTEFVILPGMEYDIIGTCTENPHAKDGDDRNLIRKGGEKFMVSDKSSRDTQADLHHRAMMTIFGGALFAIVCLAGILGQFGLM